MVLGIDVPNAPQERAAMRRFATTTAAAILTVAIASAAWADNVDLVTLPARQSVQLTIYNSEDLTLVKEIRSLSLKKGSNKLQFSWANTLIDPTSVEIRPLEHAADIEVADTVFPGQKPQHLVWNIESKFEGQVKVEVTYFTSGLTWQMDYVATCDPAEAAMKMRGYVRVVNNSGEEYDHAEIRMIVGTINLVEKIADLARRQGQEMPRSGTAAFGAYRRDAAKDVAAKGERALAEVDEESIAKVPRKMVKEGLSEYFMFSVPGTETVPNGWSKRMEAVKADAVKFDIVYRMRGYEYGDRPVRLFIWRNDDEHKLGESPLPDGLVRIFRDNGTDGLAYLGEKLLRYVPIKAEIEVNLGSDDLVVYEMKKDQVSRSNFAYDPKNNDNVCGWDEKQQWIHTIRNYREKPIAFELRLMIGGDVEYTSEVQTTLFDYRTTETKLSVPARAKKEYPCTVLTHQGTNGKQQRITLKDATK
jgi:hypothetical protein